MNATVTTLPVPTGNAAEIMERVLLQGDLSHLSAEERHRFYMETCSSLGLNPLTGPFAYIRLNGKLVLYAKRDACDQLRRLNGISIEIVQQDLRDGLFLVIVRAKDKHGRTDSDLGIVSVAGLRGEALANAMLKAITKGKRRVTLSICGLGWLDETEIDSIQQADQEKRQHPPAKPETKSTKLEIKTQFGEVIEFDRSVAGLIDALGYLLRHGPKAILANHPILMLADRQKHKDPLIAERLADCRTAADRHLAGPEEPDEYGDAIAAKRDEPVDLTDEALGIPEPDDFSRRHAAVRGGAIPATDAEEISPAEVGA